MSTEICVPVIQPICVVYPYPPSVAAAAPLLRLLTLNMLAQSPLPAGSARSEREQIGDVTQYETRYVAAVTRKKETLSVIQDRAFNTESMLNAYAGTQHKPTHVSPAHTRPHQAARPATSKFAAQGCFCELVGGPRSLPMLRRYHRI